MKEPVHSIRSELLNENRLLILKWFWVWLLVAGLGSWPGVTMLRGELYDLKKVGGIQVFGGSAGAKELLARNGFVVADPAFKQIFEPYIESPQTAEESETNREGSVLPAFITTDSAWHTYHVLLEEGVKQMEETQARRLHKFSQQLLRAATEQKAGTDLILFASVGLALQDAQYRQSLPPQAKRIVDGLRASASPVEVPIGFELAPQQFRAQSFYTQSPELSDYFAARQWYGSVVFRLTNAQETKSAVLLATLVNGSLDLMTLWKQLSDPFDAFLARAEDGMVPEYAAAAKAVLGAGSATTSISEAQVREIQQKLEGELPLPQVNDQLLSPEQYLEFWKVTRGFRLLPPRRLPCAVCFQNTVDPKIPKRLYPSGLDFLAASPVLRSPAAVRAVKSEFAKDSELILKAASGPMPDSLHGEAMQLLATLQKPLPVSAPAALRTEAWSDLQLWSQLGAWAEQRHTWALHAKMTVEVMGNIEPPTGMVAPYPEFFSSLATLTRRTAEAFDKAGLKETFEVKAVAGKLKQLFDLEQKASQVRDVKEMEALEKMSGGIEQLGQFRDRYYEQHQAEMTNGGARFSSIRYRQMQKDLADLAQRCAVNGTTNAAEIETLRLFYDCREDIVKKINEFAPVCDRLAELAKKSLNGKALAEGDAEWIANYGVTLAGFHFYYGNSYEVPRDDFPIVTRIYSSPLMDSMLYAGLARSQALYVIVPKGKSLQLYRGAVMTYREFVRPNDQLLDDESWRELVAKGQTPPAPPFTKSFYAETSVGELLKKLQAQSRSEDANYGDMEEILWQIRSRAIEKDLPQLFDVLTRASGEQGGDIVEGIGEIIGKLPWESYPQQLNALLGSPDEHRAGVAAGILLRQPSLVDRNALIAGFDREPLRTRRWRCAILGQLPRPTEATRKLWLQALHDPASGMRWQAVTAIEWARWNDAESQAALLATLDDTNEFVGAVAAHALARLGATNTAPALFAGLNTALQSTNTPVEDLERQSTEIRGDLRDGGWQATAVLDPDDMWMRLSISARVTENMRRREAMRLPPMMLSLREHNYDRMTALIEALGDLGYTPAAAELMKLGGTDYDDAAMRSLGKLIPDQMAGKLIATAKDQKLDSYLREKALVTLCDIGATNRVRELIPLLDDTTPIEYSRPLPGQEWRVCDRAAETMAILLGWQGRMSPMFVRPEQREETMKRVLEWANSATSPANP